MKIETELDAIEWMSAAKALAVVSAWNTLGLFEKMRKGPVRRADIGADPRAVEVMVPVLLHVGLLATDGENIALTPTAERLLQEGGMPSERNLDALRDLGRTHEVLRDGGPVRDDAGRPKATLGGTTPEDLVKTERFLDMLYRISGEAAKSTVDWLGPHLPKGGAVLDLGGGHGRYARAFADAGHRVTLFDQPGVVGLAKKRHGDRLSYLEGDFHKTADFGGPYDLVLLCNIVHGETPAANASLVARAAKSLRSGGRIAIRDMILEGQGQDPARAVFFGMTVLFYTGGGRSPTMSEAKDWFAAAGLVDFRLVVTGTHQIATARKA